MTVEIRPPDPLDDIIKKLREMFADILSMKASCSNSANGGDDTALCKPTAKEVIVYSSAADLLNQAADSIEEAVDIIDELPGG